MKQTTRLDVLIYAHDGRGLGHASRSIGVGMALRRKYPELKVLFVSGCSFSQELIGAAPLDWLKLPSYETEVVGGKSKGIPGKSMFSDEQLGQFRAKELSHLIGLYRPRLVLVDHTPQGKHKELAAALSASGSGDTRWVLGVRGVVGSVTQVSSELARKFFKSHYNSVLWYGDKKVLGTSHCRQLEKLYDMVPVECGYVLRMAEFCLWNDGFSSAEETLAGTVSIPWIGERTLDFIEVLAGAINKISQDVGCWHIFIDTTSSAASGNKIRRLFKELGNCRLEPPGANYAKALSRSKSVVIFGGYNSLMDVLHTGVPALVVLRQMKDEEQQLHLKLLKEVAGESITTVSESQNSVDELESLLLSNLHKKRKPLAAVKTDGAPRAADYLYSLLS